MQNLASLYVGMVEHIMEFQKDRTDIDPRHHSKEAFLRDCRTISIDMGRMTCKSVAAMTLAQKHCGAVVVMNGALRDWILEHPGIDRSRVFTARDFIKELQENGSRYRIVVIDEPKFISEKFVREINKLSADTGVEHIVRLGTQ